MMMTTITREQARALAELVHLLRPEWDAQGILAAVAKAREKASVDVVCIAAIRAAATPTNRTPAVIPLDGEHWQQPATDLSSTSVVPGPRDARCDVVGHEHYRIPCKGCRSEALASEADTNPLALHPDQAARNAKHAARLRALLHAPDARELAAGDQREDD